MQCLKEYQLLVSLRTISRGTKLWVKYRWGNIESSESKEMLKSYKESKDIHT